MAFAAAHKCTLALTTGDLWPRRLLRNSSMACMSVPELLTRFHTSSSTYTAPSARGDKSAAAGVARKCYPDCQGRDGAQCITFKSILPHRIRPAVCEALQLESGPIQHLIFASSASKGSAPIEDQVSIGSTSRCREWVDRRQRSRSNALRQLGYLASHHPGAR